MAQPDSLKLIARNVAAVRRFTDQANPPLSVAGNPVSTRLESGVGNCFPGLECDLRNLERRFFPFLEVDELNNSIVVVSVAAAAVSEARAAGQLSRVDEAVYEEIDAWLAAGRTVLVAELGGSFGELGERGFKLALPALNGAPEQVGDLGTPSSGPGRAPPDAWTAVRLLTEGRNVTVSIVNDADAEIRMLTGPRARYLDDNGALAAAFQPGELSQSLCSPWTHDFRDCGCFYWASNHPDIVQPVLPNDAVPGQVWNQPVPWERRDRTIQATPPANATQARPTPVELRHYEINNRWQELHFVVGRREITAPFAQKPVEGVPLGGIDQLRRSLAYAAGVELAVAQEYLTAAYSLKSDADPSLAAKPGLRDDVRAARAEFMRIAIGEMRHTRAVNDVLRGLSEPAAYVPALRVASEVPHHDPGPFRPVMARAATHQAIDDFVQIEAQSTGVDGLYNDILATFRFPPADVKPFVTDEWIQAIRSIIAEGEDHFETFLDMKEWLRPHAESDYLRAVDLAPPPVGDADDAALQAAYVTLLDTLFVGYKKGRFLGATEINGARQAMVSASGVTGKAQAVADRNMLVVFLPPGDPRFSPIDPPAFPVA